jgi:hypothetical protein
MQPIQIDLAGAVGMEKPIRKTTRSNKKDINESYVVYRCSSQEQVSILSNVYTKLVNLLFSKMGFMLSSQEHTPKLQDAYDFVQLSHPLQLVILASTFSPK